MNTALMELAHNGNPDDTTAMITGISFVIGMSIIVLGLIIAGLWFALGVIRTKSAAKQSDDYRALLTRFEAEQQRTNEQLAQITTDSAQIKARVQEVERIMREVP